MTGTHTRTLGLAIAAVAMSLYGCFSETPVVPQGEEQGIGMEGPLGLPDHWSRLQLDRLSTTAEGPAMALSGGQLVELPAGSTDALQAAIGAAGAGGVVFVRSGAHTEGGTVTISQPVAIIGEPGAVLTVDTAADPGDFVLDPALHVLGTSHVLIWGLELRPSAAAGGVGILLENSPSCLIGRNRILDHQNSILMQDAAGTIIKENTIVVTPLWQTGALLEADGIINVNGADVVIEGNDISGGFFGVFASDAGGKLVGNHLHGNYFGAICCCVPEGAFQLPSGATIGSDVSCTNWLITKNKATDSFAAGILVIDGANKNTVKANSGGGNGTYDIELVGESMRFGFCTPTSFQNTVIAAPYNNVVIKDCGLNNKVNGGVQVDTAGDPCDAPCP